MTFVARRILSIGLAFAALLALLPATETQAQRDRYDRRMVIINETGRTIYSFHATNKSVTVWGADLLGQDVIEPGRTYVLNFNDGTGYCMFDFKAVLDNGRAIERYRVDVCTAASWRVQ